jgi:hypothetical protein
MDPRIRRLIAKYAIAKGDFLIRRKTGGRFADPEVLAGWVLERSGGDVLQAIQAASALRIDQRQRRELLDVLRPLTMVLDLTRPLIQLAHR